MDHHLLVDVTLCNLKIVFNWQTACYKNIYTEVFISYTLHNNKVYKDR